MQFPSFPHRSRLFFPLFHLRFAAVRLNIYSPFSQAGHLSASLPDSIPFCLSPLSYSLLLMKQIRLAFLSMRQPHDICTVHPEREHGKRKRHRIHLIQISLCHAKHPVLSEDNEFHKKADIHQQRTQRNIMCQRYRSAKYDNFDQRHLPAHRHDQARRCCDSLSSPEIHIKREIMAKNYTGCRIDRQKRQYLLILCPKQCAHHKHGNHTFKCIAEQRDRSCFPFPSSEAYSWFRHFRFRICGYQFHAFSHRYSSSETVQTHIRWQHKCKSFHLTAQFFPFFAHG